jgi:NitT/TauT family transport system substrate-binding protein
MGMKKISTVLLALALAAGLFCGCSGKNADAGTEAGTETVPAQTGQANQNAETSALAEPADDGATEPADDAAPIRIGGLTGATSIGMVKLMEDAANGVSQNEYEFTLAGSADELTPKLIQGQLDIAAIPANLASVLYNNTDGAVKLLAVNTLGVLYIVAKGEEIGSISDLKGKTVYATAKGSVPEYVLRYILSSNGLDPDGDVTIEFKSEPNEVVALMAAGEASLAMLPQPYVTIAAGQVEGLTTALDLTEEWEKLDNGSALITGSSPCAASLPSDTPSGLGPFSRNTRLRRSMSTRMLRTRPGLSRSSAYSRRPSRPKPYPIATSRLWRAAIWKRPWEAISRFSMTRTPRPWAARFRTRTSTSF